MAEPGLAEAGLDWAIAAPLLVIAAFVAVFFWILARGKKPPQ